jgi:hypothetical protein
VFLWENQLSIELTKFDSTHALFANVAFTSNELLLPKDFAYKYAHAAAVFDLGSVVDAQLKATKGYPSGVHLVENVSFATNDFSRLSPNPIYTGPANVIVDLGGNKCAQGSPSTPAFPVHCSAN